MKKEKINVSEWENTIYHLGMINQFITDHGDDENLRSAFNDIVRIIKATKIFLRKRGE